MKPSLEPYIGVSCVQSASEAVVLSGIAEKAGIKKDKRFLALGVAVSTEERSRTFNRELKTTDQVISVCKAASEGTEVVIHFNGEKTEETEFVSKIVRFLQPIMASGGCNTVQLNKSISKQFLSVILEYFPDLKVVCSLNPELLETSVDRVLREIDQRRKYIEGVLIDSSAGRGMGLDISPAIDLYRKISAEFPRINIGFAGGFSPENVGEKTQTIFEDTGFLPTIDAETHILGRNDRIDMDKARRYLEAAIKAVQ